MPKRSLPQSVTPKPNRQPAARPASSHLQGRCGQLRQPIPAGQAEGKAAGCHRRLRRSRRISRCRGCDPTASRMPNSRVRPLTENASTPATPTTAIGSATPAKTPKTIRLSRSGESTFARISSRASPACFHRLVRRQLPHDPRDRRNQRIRIGASVNEQPPCRQKPLLIERMIHRQCRPGRHVLHCPYRRPRR